MLDTDTRAIRLKKLLMESLDKVEPEASADLNAQPEKMKAVDAIIDGVVQAFDILMDKPK